MPSAATTLLLALAAAVAGEGTPPPAPVPAPAPAPIATSGPAPASPEITLQDAVARAVARNPTVSTAVAQIERADGLVREARAGWYPTLVGNAAYTRLDHERKLGDRTLSSADQLSGNLQLTVPLVAPLAWANTSTAERNRRIAEGNAGEVRREVAAATARAYLTVVAQHRIIAAAEAARANAKAHFDFAHSRLLGGLGRSIDEVRAQQDLATVEVQVQAAYVGLARAQEALGVLVAADGTVDSVADVALSAPPPLAAALSDARALRPDVKSVERRVASSQKSVDEVWVYYSPYLAAVGQPFFQVGSALQPQAGWQAQLLLTLPLYDGGTRGGISQERRALLAQARADMEATVRQAQSEVRLGFVAMLRADQALLSAREAARLAKRASALADLAYQAGATTNIEVIDAARRERDADVGAAQAEDAARQARLDLLVASGHFP